MKIWQAVIIVLVILIMLLIILSRKTELRIISQGKLTVEIQTVLFRIELTNFKKIKKKRGSFSALKSFLHYILKHSEFYVNGISVSYNTSYAAASAYSAFFSFIFAYIGSISDKIFLPSDVGKTSLPFAFDIKIKARLSVFLFAFDI